MPVISLKKKPLRILAGAQKFLSTATPSFPWQGNETLVTSSALMWHQQCTSLYLESPSLAEAYASFKVTQSSCIQQNGSAGEILTSWPPLSSTVQPQLPRVPQPSETTFPQTWGSFATPVLPASWTNDIPVSSCDACPWGWGRGSTFGNHWVSFCALL